MECIDIFCSVKKQANNQSRSLDLTPNVLYLTDCFHYQSLPALHNSIQNILCLKKQFNEKGYTKKVFHKYAYIIHLYRCKVSRLKVPEFLTNKPFLDINIISTPVDMETYGSR